MALTVIKKMVMFNIVEIPSVIFSPKRWKRDSTEHRDNNDYNGCDHDKHYNDDDSNGDHHDDKTAEDYSVGDLTIKSRKFGEHQRE